MSMNIVLSKQLPPSPEDSITLPSLTLSSRTAHAVCVCLNRFKMHTHTALHTPPIVGGGGEEKKRKREKKDRNLPQEALSEVKLLLAFKPQGKCQVSPK